MKNLIFVVLVLCGAHVAMDANTEVEINSNEICEASIIVEDTVKEVQHNILYKYATASFYGPGFHGKKTSNGERFDKNAMTCAHKTLAFGTRLLVTNCETGESVIVRVNDRGPYVKGRVVDLSEGAAKKISISGVGKVKIEILN